jgi:signal transduction histidine kinase
MIEQIGRRANEIIGVLEDLRVVAETSAEPAPNKRPRDLCDEVENQIADVMSRAEPLGIKVEPRMPRKVIVETDDRVSYCIGVLLDNAIDAILERREQDPDFPEGGKILVRCAPEGNMVKVEVEDDGVGMSQWVRERVFGPMFTTKQKSDWLGGLEGVEVGRTVEKRAVEYKVRLPLPKGAKDFDAVKAESGIPVVTGSRAVDGAMLVSVRETNKEVADCFWPFFRRTNSGVGLFTVKRVIEANGGDVDEFSKGDFQGSTFTIRLPVTAQARGSVSP